MARDTRGGDRHRNPAVQFRPGAETRAWLDELSEVTGRPVNQLAASAVELYRLKPEIINALLDLIERAERIGDDASDVDALLTKVRQA